MNQRIDSYYSILMEWFIFYSLFSFYSLIFSDFRNTKRKTFKSGRQSNFISFDDQSTTRRATLLLPVQIWKPLHSFYLPCAASPASPTLINSGSLGMFSQIKETKKKSHNFASPEFKRRNKFVATLNMSEMRLATLKSTSIAYPIAQASTVNRLGRSQENWNDNSPKNSISFLSFAITTAPQISFFFNHFQCN